jgi:hypothetical protein
LYFFHTCFFVLIALVCSFVFTERHTNKHPCPRRDGFEPAFPAIKLPQIYALGSTATGLGEFLYMTYMNCLIRRIKLAHSALWLSLYALMHDTGHILVTVQNKTSFRKLSFPLGLTVAHVFLDKKKHRA